MFGRSARCGYHSPGQEKIDETLVNTTAYICKMDKPKCKEGNEICIQLAYIHYFSFTHTNSLAKQRYSLVAKTMTYCTIKYKRKL